MVLRAALADRPPRPFAEGRATAGAGSHSGSEPDRNPKVSGSIRVCSNCVIIVVSSDIVFMLRSAFITRQAPELFQKRWENLNDTRVQPTCPLGGCNPERITSSSPRVEPRGKGGAVQPWERLPRG